MTQPGAASARTTERILMKLFVDTGSVKDIEALAALGILDGVTTNPSLLAKEAGDYRQIPQADLPDREGTGERRSRGHRLRWHGPRRARHCGHRRAHGGQGPVHERRCPGLSHAVVRGDARQRHADFFLTAGLARREGGSRLRQPVRRAPRRRGRHRHDPGARDRRHLHDKARTRPKCSSRASAVRFTSSKPRAWVRTS